MNTILSRCPLFEGVPAEKITELTTALGGHTRAYTAGSILLQMEDTVTEMGVLLSGSVCALMSSPEGRVLLVSRLSPPELFADVLAVGRGASSPVTIEAETDCRVLWLPTQHLMQESSTLPLRDLLLRNLTAALSAKYFALQRRLLCLSQGSLRQKILFYLVQEQADAHSGPFSIPFDRAGLARYLGAERSALSRELSRMRQDGLIGYRKNLFTLYPKS